MINYQYVSQVSIGNVAKNSLAADGFYTRRLASRQSLSSLIVNYGVSAKKNG